MYFKLLSYGFKAFKIGLMLIGILSIIRMIVLADIMETSVIKIGLIISGVGSLITGIKHADIEEKDEKITLNSRSFRLLGIAMICFILFAMLPSNDVATTLSTMSPKHSEISLHD